MKKRGRPRKSEGWVEFIIILFVVLSVLGAVLLALQDQAVDIGSTANLPRTPKPVTPTPTPAASFGMGRGDSTPIPTPGIVPRNDMPPPDGFVTPTPTPVFLPTVSLN